MEVADLGVALLIFPAGQGGLRRLVARGIDDAGGYPTLAGAASAPDPDLT